MIFKGGKIIPVPVAAPVKALAIRGGKILALGSESAVDALKTKSSQIVDLQGRVLMPGFVDPHNHTVLSALIFASPHRRRIHEISHPRAVAE